MVNKTVFFKVSFLHLLVATLFAALTVAIPESSYGRESARYRARTLRTQSQSSGSVILSESFEGDSLRNWRVLWGDVAIENGELSLSSQPPTNPLETHSALVISRKKARDFSFEVTTRTLAQLRRNSPPNAWEVGWVFFRYRDLENYYYFILKPNGYELGKKHGSDDQIFLATGTGPRLAIGQSYRLRIIASGANIRIYVNGKEVVNYTDANPLLYGAVGLYEEDSLARFDDVNVTKL